MSDVAIKVENLGKQFQIGAHQAAYSTLRETITDTISAPFRRLGKVLRGDASGASELNETIWALKDVSFEVKHGEVLGIIGHNGAGKSTLLKILSRITEPSTGSVDIYGRVGALLEVGTGFHQELTGRENIYLNAAILGMKRAEINRKFDEIVAFAEVEKFIDTPVKHYSSGMGLRLGFAVAAYLEPEILIVDEVLAVGDAAFQKKCLGKMSDVAGEGRTVLFVSHNLGAVESLCNKCVVLKNGNLVFNGDLRPAILHYMHQSPTNYVEFDQGSPLRSVSMKQKDDELLLTAHYSHTSLIDLPNLGFVIKDFLGNPICGTNPLLENLNAFQTPKKSGSLSVTIKQPKLLNGTYRLSVWFGDSTSDFFHSIDCLSFEVVNMTQHKQLNSTSVGSIAPLCIWDFK